MTLSTLYLSVLIRHDLIATAILYYTDNSSYFCNFHFSNLSFDVNLQYLDNLFGFFFFLMLCLFYKPFSSSSKFSSPVSYFSNIQVKKAEWVFKVLCLHALPNFLVIFSENLLSFEKEPWLSPCSSNFCVSAIFTCSAYSASCFMSDTKKTRHKKFISRIIFKIPYKFKYFFLKYLLK